MTKKSAAGTYLKVSQIRERQRRLELARVQAEKQKARDKKEQLETAQAKAVEAIRDQVSDSAISAASLSLMSDATLANHRRSEEASKTVESYSEPLEEAKKALVSSRAKRRVVEKMVERRKTRDAKRRQKKVDRLTDEQTATRAQNKSTD